MSYVNKINKNSVDYDLYDARIGELDSAVEGQLLGINAQKKLVPVDAPETGVISFNGRSGAVNPTSGDYTAEMVGAIASTEKGANGGVAELDSDGKVPSSQLPSYVDDVLEFANRSAFPATGESGKIYIALDDNKTYRWGGSTYVVIGSSLALGETEATAYRGDRGKTAYDHSQLTSGNPHNVSKSDVGLGNVGNFKAVSTVASQGLNTTEQSNARANIGAGTSSFSGSYNDLSDKPSIPSAIAAKGTATRPVYISATDVATPCTYGFGIDSTGPYIESF